MSNTNDNTTPAAAAAAAAAAAPAATAIRRTFLYNGRTLNDPDPSLSPERVKEFYATIHPELTNATIEGGDFDGDVQTWTFARGVGTKG